MKKPQMVTESVLYEVLKAAKASGKVELLKKTLAIFLISEYLVAYECYEMAVEKDEPMTFIPSIVAKEAIAFLNPHLVEPSDDDRFWDAAQLAKRYRELAAEAFKETIEKNIPF